MGKAQVDWRGIGWFVFLSLGLTWGIELLMITRWEVSFLDIPPVLVQYVVAALMWAPALATFLVIRFITGEGTSGLGLKLGPWQPYAGVYCLIPLLFTASYTLTWLLGLGKPDWTLARFLESIAGLAPGTVYPPAGTILGGLAAASLTFAPFINSIFAFGEELGWRGYLLPKLMPLGKARALLLSGIIWGLWHAPLVAVGFNYSGYPLVGFIMMTFLTTSFGVYIGYLRLKYNSVVLASFAHGVFNAQAYGIWRPLFPDTNPLLGGFTGLTGILVLGVVALWCYRRIPWKK